MVFFEKNQQKIFFDFYPKGPPLGTLSGVPRILGRGGRSCYKRAGKGVAIPKNFQFIRAKSKISAGKGG